MKDQVEQEYLKCGLISICRSVSQSCGWKTGQEEAGNLNGRRCD